MAAEPLSAVIFWVRSGQLTWQWTIPVSNREYIFKRAIFHCHVSSLGFQPIWKICSSKWVKIFPNFRGEHSKKSLSCHHLGNWPPLDFGRLWVTEVVLFRVLSSARFPHDSGGTPTSKGDSAHPWGQSHRFFFGIRWKHPREVADS